MIGTILGSGTGIPSLQRHAPAYLLEVAAKRWLIDCGSGSLLQLERIGKPFSTLDGLWITHTHADHVGELSALLHALRMPGLQRQKPFHLFGPAGFIAFFRQIVVPVVAVPEAFPFFVSEVTERQSLGELLVQSSVVSHSERFESRSYRFDYAGKSIVFSGDCDYDPRLRQLAAGADLLIIDCSTLHAGKVKGHLSAREAGKLAAEAEVKRLILSHLYPIDGREDERIEECQSQFSGPLALATDLMEFAV
ncbi:MBL fold metallo-hydrolase [Candidatus Magnetaquicoccus inordinatus]|uniref:MBL fold metallo-hydrolase n=1 Tax=Candidatus Magnetaquicoccus inordinatus TaxID=2496818 RepID=UPI00102C42C1|nr:MBL fold metallo-hydrolase [Candidatus Magnetaquicoccus inordinatus]